MRGSLKLFTWLGIPVHLHWTFFLIFFYIFGVGHLNGLGWQNTLWISVFFVVLFACVLLHEYGHALAARRYGVRTQDIILTPVGGVARLEYMPEKPTQEFVVAIAGPLVNVFISAGLYMGSWALLSEEHLLVLHWWLEQSLLLGAPVEAEAFYELEPSLRIELFYLSALISANVVLVVFNLIPAFPMDGGRILRAMLAARMSRVQATQIAARLGQAIAALFVVIGLWKTTYALALIGIFIFVLAQAESQNVCLEALLRRFKAADLVRTSFTRLSSADWMQTPIHLLQTGLERHFLVFDMQGRLLGVLEEKNIMEALRCRDYAAPVEKYLKAKVTIVPREARLEYVHFLIRREGLPLIAVAYQGELIGVIDENGLSQFLKMHR